MQNKITGPVRSSGVGSHFVNWLTAVGILASMGSCRARCVENLPERSTMWMNRGDGREEQEAKARRLLREEMSRFGWDEAALRQAGKGDE